MSLCCNSCVHLSLQCPGGANRCTHYWLTCGLCSVCEASVFLVRQLHVYKHVCVRACVCCVLTYVHVYAPVVQDGVGSSYK